VAVSFIGGPSDQHRDGHKYMVIKILPYHS